MFVCGDAAMVKKPKAKLKKGDNVDEIPNTVQETSPDQSQDSKICELVGINLRRLSDGLRLCFAGTIQPGKTTRKVLEGNNQCTIRSLRP